MDCCLIKHNHSHCAYCSRVMAIADHEVIFCSVDCACMAGRFSIKDGLINQDQPIKTGTPKIPWWLPSNKEEEWIAKITGQIIN